MRDDSDVAVSGLPARAYFRAMAVVSDIPDRDVDLVDLDYATPFTRYLREAEELRRVG